MVLLVGYGNSMRSDDGVGIYIADQIASEKIVDLEVRTVQQLGPELLDDLGKYQKIIFADARETGPEVQICRLNSDSSSKEAAYPSSHHLNPALLLVLAKKIYQTDLNIFVCTVRGENFEFGDSLSRVVKKRAQNAIKEIKTVLVPEKESKYARS